MPARSEKPAVRLTTRTGASVTGRAAPRMPTRAERCWTATSIAQPRPVAVRLARPNKQRWTPASAVNPPSWRLTGVLVGAGVLRPFVRGRFPGHSRAPAHLGHGHRSTSLFRIAQNSPLVSRANAGNCRASRWSWDVHVARLAVSVVADRVSDQPEPEFGARVVANLNELGVDVLCDCLVAGAF